jgi:hypothetical protein
VGSDHLPDGPDDERPEDFDYESLWLDDPGRSGRSSYGRYAHSEPGRGIGLVAVAFVVVLTIALGTWLTDRLSSPAVRGDCFGGVYLNGVHVCGDAARALCNELAIPGRFPPALADDIRSGCESIRLPVPTG